MTAILLLCTANACRSVMAQALLSARLTTRDGTASVRSAGMTGSGRPPSPEVIAVMATRGIDVTGHRSRTVTAADLTDADLILGLAREHVRYAVARRPQAWPRAFTIRELLRHGRRAGARTPGEPLGDWLERAAPGRARQDLLGRAAADDVADPTGGPLQGYQATASLLDRLTRDLADLGWPS